MALDIRPQQVWHLELDSARIASMVLGERDRSNVSLIQLNAAQAEVLAWIVEGCSPGVFPGNTFAHRITARALQSRGLVVIAGHGESWRATPTARGRAWPAVVDAERRELAARNAASLRGGVAGGEGLSLRAATRQQQEPLRGTRPERSISVTQVNRQERYMRYKVLVTRVQVAERRIRATDEEDAARKAQEEFEKPYAYFGHWETRGSEIEVVEAEQTTIIPPNLLDESGPMLLSIKNAAEAIGIPHRALGLLASQGDIECTRIGTRKYVSREALLAFIRTNTQRGNASS